MSEGIKEEHTNFRHFMLIINHVYAALGKINVIENFVQTFTNIPIRK